jgi:hypothetical protein
LKAVCRLIRDSTFQIGPMKERQNCLFVALGTEIGLKELENEERLHDFFCKEFFGNVKRMPPDDEGQYYILLSDRNRRPRLSPRASIDRRRISCNISSGRSVICIATCGGEMTLDIGRLPDRAMVFLCEPRDDSETPKEAQ